MCFIVEKGSSDYIKTKLSSVLHLFFTLLAKKPILIPGVKKA